MSSDEVFRWAVALSVAALAVWAVFIFFVPGCLCSMFRYRLWRLRDAVKDDILQGRLPNDEFIAEFLSMIEAFIIVASGVTLIQVLLLPASEGEVERRRQAQKQSISRLADGPRTLFLAYRKEFMAIIVKRLFTGSLTGWVLLAALLPAILLALVYRLIQRASVSTTDLIISIIDYIGKALRRRDTGFALTEVTAKIATMRVMSKQTKSLCDCAA